MQVERNSIWLITRVDGIKDGKYRVLAQYANYDLLILYRLHDEKCLEMPVPVKYPLFLESAKCGNSKISSYLTPFYQLISEEDISPAHRVKRNNRFELINDLISNPEFLLDVALNQRSKIVASHAKERGVYVQKIYRSLNQYWQYGQEINALLPAYKHCGGSGKYRLSGIAKRGAPIQLSTPSMVAPLGVNTTEEDKTKFLLGMKKYALRGKKVSLNRVYEQMLKEFYADELQLAETEHREPALPSLRSFRYWIKRLVPEAELIRKQTTAGDFERNRRGLRGSATDHTEVPGSCFELDATVLDVHIVSEFNRNHVLGRPTVYCVVDKESRMIVGLHVSMEYASWRAGRQALVNSFTSKKAYCARFGIDIDESEWPCHHIPQRLLCDRGEFICNKPEELAVPLIGHLSIAPPYRADLKGIVEHRFHILNEKLIHELKGTTRGRHYIRGDRDPRLDATLTLTEVTRLLIDQVLEHNSSIFDGLAGQTLLLVEASLPPTPLNYWNIHLKKHRHALNKADEADIRARLLPVEQVSMTSKGVRLNDDMYYECDREEFEDWKVIARTNGRWKLEARFDQDNASFIYVRFRPNEGFTRCQLMLHSANFEARHRADVLYFEDWKKVVKKRSTPTGKSIERHNRRKAITVFAQEELKREPALNSKSEKISNIKERRRDAIMDARLTSDDDFAELHERESSVDCIAIEKASNVITLLKRARSPNNEN
ncbi:transposase [Escherichia coli]|uniref:transposase n=1 Tax=Vibrio cincinnatiensis TaxID=675 RepID=UPI000FA3E574|nr:transposase [Vibrio cincinnatiensis]EEV6181614.1 transposase [Escherichia coli]EEW1007169.1 transposase [Escherichia coli]EFH9091892.1 transposase [Escherichia coli]MCG3760893.1 transposase [Vibrio cincinnatiensis]MCG3764204.1 transposase [Vibrio cincinnatiensis]